MPHASLGRLPAAHPFRSRLLSPATPPRPPLHLSIEPSSFCPFFDGRRRCRCIFKCGIYSGPIFSAQRGVSRKTPAGESAPLVGRLVSLIIVRDVRHDVPADAAACADANRRALRINIAFGLTCPRGLPGSPVLATHLQQKRE